MHFIKIIYGPYIVQKKNVKKNRKGQNLAQTDVHAYDITHTCMNFFRFQSIQFFDEVEKGNLAVIESSNISETGQTTPTKVGMYACDVNPYLHDFL